MTTTVPEFTGSARQQVAQMLEWAMTDSAVVKAVPTVPDMIARGKAAVNVYTTRLTDFDGMKLTCDLTVNVMVNGGDNLEAIENDLEDMRDAVLTALQLYAYYVQIQDATRVKFEDNYPGYDIKITALMKNPYRA